MKRVLLALALIFVSSGVVHAQDLNNFVINDFRVDMELGRDGDQRSTLFTVETITATFPDFDQNRGLERVFVKSYDDHPTSFELLSVTDGQGNELNYHWAGDALLIGDKDQYVYGQQTYEISYSQRDVTKFYADTERSEFYWDAIGDEWRVPVEQARVNLTIDDAVTDQLQTELFCYQGGTGSRDDCDNVSTQPGSYTVTASDLEPGEAVTMAVGFELNTFEEYQQSTCDKLKQGLTLWAVGSSLVSLPLAIIALPVFSWVYGRKKDRESELKPIAPQYAPPENFSVSAASHLIKSQNVFAAQLVELAVDGYININQVKNKGLFRSAEYEVEVMKDLIELKPEEQEILSDMFVKLPNVGERLNMELLKNNTSFARRLYDNEGEINRLARSTYGLREKNSELGAWAKTIAKRTTWFGLLTLNFTVFISSAILHAQSSSPWRLSDKGLELKRYLLGLKDYIELAEKDRIAFLQSPEGAETAPAAADDEKQRMILYEKTLPFAMLFGQEKGWSEQLGEYYQKLGAEPGWYHGASGFNVANFSNDMGNISSAARSASSYSSSSGGSSGGGSSGGGGGGGGGGGW